jgi:cation:H+ antiporter
MLMSVALLVGGLAALVCGGELLVRGAVRISRLAGISPLVIGLTVVAFGTSAPELAVSMKAGLTGQSEIAVGNIVGSNIFNVLLILGVASLITPLVTSSQLIRRDVPLMIFVSILVLALAWDGRVDRVDGVLLFAGLIVYTVWSIRASRREIASVQRQYEQEYGAPLATTPRTWPTQVVLIAVGLAILVLGADWLVRGATSLARLWGMSELLIGLTIVAVGTSLPEVATSLIASLHGERDIAVGNVVGSNLFNLMCVMGLAAVVTPGGMVVPDTALRVDIPVMIVVAVACLPIFFTGHLIARWEGALFLFYYVAYTTYLVLAAVQPAVSRDLATMLLGFALPLTAITLVVCVARAVRRGNPPPPDA